MFKKELRLRWVKSHCELMSLPEVAPLLSVENSIKNGKNFPLNFNLNLDF